MEFTAAQIASFIGGKVIGDENAVVSSFAPVEEAKSGQISFVAQEKFKDLISSSEATILIVSEELLKEETHIPAIISVENAYLSFQVLMNLYQQMKQKRTGIEQPVFISEQTRIGEDVYIGSFTHISDKVTVGNSSQIYPQVFIGQNVKIGENCVIYSGVRIYDGTRIGNNCIIHANTVIGADGFGFQPDKDKFHKIPQLGNVIIEDDVEIGSNCSIDRGTIGSTIIGKGTKLDNLIQVAHNVKIGENNVIAAQAGIAGSTTVGNWNQIGGQAGLAGHITVGNQVRIQGQSGVNSNTPDGETLYGSPAISAGDFRRSYILFKKLPELSAQIDNLEKALKKTDNE